MKKKLGRKILKWLGLILAAFFVGTLLWVVVLKWVPVRCTPLMIHRAIEYRSDSSFKTLQTWVSLDKISPYLMKAVIASEDNRFPQHSGFDLESIRRAEKVNRKAGKIVQGASTISQQTAKNVFLWSGRSWLRKGLEAYFTVLIEQIWGKQRIMEVYLNVAEFGRGVYGAEAAARKFFRCSASSLSLDQSCLMAASLPSPLKRNLARPGKYHLKRAGQIKNLIGKIEYPAWIRKPGK